MIAPVALADPVLRAEDATSGSLRDRLAAPDGADLVVLYGGDQRGSMDVCGCDVRPLGSLARVEGYRQAVERGDVPSILVNAGGFLDDGLAPDGGLRADVDVAAVGMVEGLQRGDWVAWNVGFEDLPWFAAHAFPPEAVSANLDGPIDVPVWRVVPAGDLTVAITGVAGSAAGDARVEGWTTTNPVDAVKDALAQVPPADVIVVLAWNPGRAARGLAQIPGVDVLVEVGADPARFPPLWEGEAVWVRAPERAMRLGELRLDLDGGAVVAATDRQIDLDARIPSDPELRRLQAQTRGAVEAAREAALAPPSGTW